MALRIKSHWHDDGTERSLDQVAGALAYIAWRIAKDRAINLHGEDFVYENDEQRLAVIQEYLFFQIQIVDRLAHRMLDDDSRRALVRATALRVAEHVQDNGEDLLGSGDHRGAFIDELNARAAEYAELGFYDDGPGYPFLRHLGYRVQGIMGEREQNRWVIDQVMDRDGPEITRQVTRAVGDLLT